MARINDDFQAGFIEGHVAAKQGTRRDVVAIYYGGLTTANIIPIATLAVLAVLIYVNHTVGIGSWAVDALGAVISAAQIFVLGYIRTRRGVVFSAEEWAALCERAGIESEAGK